MRILSIICLFSFNFLLAHAGNTINEGATLPSRSLNFYSFESTTSSTKKSNLDKALELNEQSFQNHPEFNKLPYNAPCESCTEDLSERTISERKFVEGDNVYIQKSYGRLHYLEGGVYKTIDSRLFPTEQTKYYQAPYQEAQISIDANAGFVSMQEKGNAIKINNRLQLLTINGNGSYFKLEDANWLSHTAGHDGVLVNNIFSNVDITCKVNTGSVKTNFILNNQLADLPNDGYLVIRDYVSLPENFTVSIDKEHAYVGDINILNASGEVIWQIGEVLIWDNNKNSITASYTLQADGALDIQIPLEWLNSPALQYPITIDPLLTSVGTKPPVMGSNYSERCRSNEGCEHILTMQTPPEVTVTDVLFTTLVELEDFGSAPCWRSHYSATVRMNGSCPVTITCTDPTDETGSCGGNTASLGTFFQSCFPTPTCAPQNVDFQMLLRRCGGDTTAPDCDARCLGINNDDWVMTIQGRTVEAESINPPQAICPEFDEAILEGEGIYGVPPYRFLWMPDSLMGQEVEADPDSTTTYRLYVIDTCDNVDSSLTTRVTVFPPLPFELTDPECVILGECIELNPDGYDGATYFWRSDPGLMSDECADPLICRNPTVCPEEDFMISVRAVDNSTGCRKFEDMSVEVCQKFLDIPTAFSPNGDGINDVLEVFSEERSVPDLIRYEIYDRWGDLVFQANQITDVWDGTHNGKPVEIGSYQVIVEVKAFDGEILSRNQNVTLIR